MGAELSGGGGPAAAGPLAYVDVASARPGDAVAVMASGDGDATVELVALEGPGAAGARTVRSEDVTLTLQPLRSGSYLRGVAPVGPLPALTLSLWVRPTLLPAEREQALATIDGAALTLTPDGRVRATVADVDLVTSARMATGTWSFVALTCDLAAGRVRLTVGDARALRHREARCGAVRALAGRLLIGARRDVRDDPHALVDGLNGRVAEPDLVATALDVDQLVARAREEWPARWSLAHVPGGGDVVADTAGEGLDLVLVNGPLRAVAGPRWDGVADDYVHAPAQFAAVHLHEDDLEDAGWAATARLPVPYDAPSGLYAARVTDARGRRAWAPFVVRPSSARRRDVAVLLPTYTYLAYANHRQAAEADFFGDYRGVTHRPIVLDAVDERLAGMPEAGLSLYEDHRDGSSTALSSRLRPMLNVAPDYPWWMTGAPRHVGADLHLLAWLRDQGHQVDVLADEDLDRDGPDALRGYRAVLTGSHPEYVTARMLDALEGHLDGGGSLLSLGGNGFYWVTGTAPGKPHVIEVRRGSSVGGPQHWDTPAWETRLQTTGEPGGLWRRRGRPPQVLCGVGFTAQGWGPGQPYERGPAAWRPEVADLFAGLADDELIGGFGPGLGGAAGDEVDRADPALGTPPGTLLLATSAGRHTAHYQVSPEDAAGREGAQARADMTFRAHPAGGIVFAVGSINWVLSLTHDNCDNNVSRVTANVLARALATGGGRSHDAR